MYSCLVHPSPFDPRIHVYQVTDLLKPDYTWIWGRLMCQGPKNPNRTYSFSLMRRRSPAALCYFAFAQVDGSTAFTTRSYTCCPVPCALTLSPIPVHVIPSACPFSSVVPLPRYRRIAWMFPFLLRILCYTAIILYQNCQTARDRG